MRLSTTVFPVLSAVALAAPQYPALNLDAAMPYDGVETISEYFNLLAQKVLASKVMPTVPVCNMANAKLPVAPKPLPAPAEGLKVKHVAVGRGTQNYTCDASNSTAPPALFGAVAVLFDASCVAATFPDLLDMLSSVAMSFNLTDTSDVLANAYEDGTRLGPSNLAVSGVHFFNTDKAPFFNLNLGNEEVGTIALAKNESTPAPLDAPIGQQGEDAVGWLRLLKTEATGGLQEVFRVGTAGGNPPKSCEGLPDSFEVEYAAQYWFFEGPDAQEEEEEAPTPA